MSNDSEKHECEKFEWGVNPLHAFIVLSIAVLIGLCGGLLFATGNIQCDFAMGQEDNFTVECWVQNNPDDPDGDAGTGIGIFKPYTNCVDMTPEQMKEFKNETLDRIARMRQAFPNIQNTLNKYVSLVQTIESSFLLGNDGKRLPYYTGTPANIKPLTNWYYTVYMPLASSDMKSIVSAAVNSLDLTIPFPDGSSRNGYVAAVGAYNSVIAYSDYLLQQADLNGLDDAVSSIQYIGDSLGHLETQTRALPTNYKDDIYVPAGNGGGSGGEGGGGDGGDTGDTGQYNWCTVEQGDAIIRLLTQCEQHQNAVKNNIESLLSQLSSRYNEMKGGSLFRTPYTGLPDTFYANGSNHNWKTFYRLGESTPSINGYDPSNILQRIELLLYGIAGVDEDEDSVTKSYDLSDFTTQKDSLDESMQGLLGNFTSDAEEHRQRAESLSESFRSFMESFSTWRGKTSLESTDAFMPSYQYSIGGESVTIPAFTVGENNATVPLVQQFGDYFHAFCSVVFYVGGVFILWSYWSWFAQWIFRFCKWTGEILSGLFVK